ncbi:MAG: hypothetical protein AABY83_14560 [Pseudomonadota bacterium]
MRVDKIAVLLAIAASGFGVSAVGADTLAQNNSIAQLCAESPWCSFMAKKVDWPIPKAVGNAFVPFSYGGFRIAVPREMHNIELLWGGMYALDYGRYKILVSTENTKDIVSNAASIKCEFDVQEFLHFFYETSTKDAEPIDECARFIAHVAFIEKRSPRYKNANNIVMMAHDDWTAYVIKLDSESNVRLVTITNRNAKDRYIKLTDNGAPDEVINAIVAGIVYKPEN